MRVSGNEKFNCDYKQLKAEYDFLSLCTPIAQFVQLTNVHHYHTGLATRYSVDGEMEYVGIFSQ